ncbi:Uncharacterised protein [uncultured archaeon]|nr:Uncharacterised protein [uncultured archaeon]
MPLTTRARKLRALRVFKRPEFRRAIPSFKARVEAVAYLKEYLDVWMFCSFPQNTRSEHVRTFNFGKQSLMIKDTQFDSHHGFIPEGQKSGIREFMKAHHAFVKEQYPRRNSKYILRTPQLYGTKERFLILENITLWKPRTLAEMDRIDEAKREVRQNFIEIEKKTKLKQPQILDLMPTGIYKGKVVFYVPYDHY